MFYNPFDPFVFERPTALSFEDYQQESKATAVYPQDHAIVYPTLGLAGESGEVAEKVKKILRDNSGVFDDAAKEALSKEIGDVLWYLSALATDLGLSLEEIAAGNLAKLKDRQQRNVLQGSGDNR